MLKTICFRSSCRPSFSIIDQQGLIDAIRIKYTKLNITGLLIMKKRVCFQIVEGDSQVLNSIYKQVKRNFGFKRVLEITNHRIENPFFNNFYAGYCITEDINSLYGLNKYLYYLQENPSTDEDLFNDIIEDLLLQSA